MNTFLQEIATDSRILLERALLNQEIACFGVDGFGHYGTHDQAQQYAVQKIEVELNEDADHDVPLAMAWITLDGYDSNRFGHLATDHNFNLSVNELLRTQEIKPNCWEWADIGVQEQHTIVLKIHVQTLLEWY